MKAMHLIKIVTLNNNNNNNIIITIIMIVIIIIIIIIIWTMYSMSENSKLRWTLWQRESNQVLILKSKRKISTAKQEKQPESIKNENMLVLAMSFPLQISVKKINENKKNNKNNNNNNNNKK